MDINYTRSIIASSECLADLAFRPSVFGLHDIYYRKANTFLADLKAATLNGCPTARAALETGKLPISVTVENEGDTFEETVSDAFLKLNAGLFNVVFDLDEGHVIDISHSLRTGNEREVEDIAYAIRDLHEMELENKSILLCAI